MINDTETANKKAIRSIITTLIFMVIIGVLVLCSAIYFALKYIVVNPINGTIEMVKDIAEGKAILPDD